MKPISIDTEELLHAARRVGDAGASHRVPALGASGHHRLDAAARSFSAAWGRGHEVLTGDAATIAHGLVGVVTTHLANDAVVSDALMRLAARLEVAP